MNVGSNSSSSSLPPIDSSKESNKEGGKKPVKIDALSAGPANAASNATTLAAVSKAQENYQVTLPTWSGPFELLLDLVKTSQLSIHEITISRITSDYLATLRALRALDVDLAADFLVLASILVQIKTRSLLPSEETFSDESLEYRDESGRALIMQLLNYQKYKEVGEQLSEKASIGDEIIFPSLETFSAPELLGESQKELPQLSLVDLLSAMERVAEKRLRMGANEFKLPKKITIPVQEKIKIFRKKLSPGSRTALSTFLPKEIDRYELLGFLFAVLELYRLGEIGAVQEGSFAEIYLFLLAAF